MYSKDRGLSSYLYAEWQNIIHLTDAKERKRAKINYYFKVIENLSSQQEFIQLAKDITLDEDLNTDEKKLIFNTMNMRIMFAIANSKMMFTIPPITGTIE